MSRAFLVCVAIMCVDVWLVAISAESVSLFWSKWSNYGAAFGCQVATTDNGRTPNHSLSTLHERVLLREQSVVIIESDTNNETQLSVTSNRTNVKSINNIV